MVSFISDRVSIIIVAHNSESVLPKCLHSVRAATAGGDHQVIIVDNDSHDNTRATVAELYPDALVLTQKRNLGFARACNVAAAAANGSYLLFLNPDVEMDSDALRVLRDTIEAEPRAGLVSARLRFPDGRFQPSCRKLPTLRNLLFSRGSFLGALASGGRAGAYTLGDYTMVAEVPAVAGTMFMVRSERFRELGGFDTRFFMYMEDTDLSRRMQRAGYINLFVPGAGGVHRWGASSPTGRLRRKWYHHRSVWQYFRKRGRPLTVWLVLPVCLTVNYVLTVLFGWWRKAR